MRGGTDEEKPGSCPFASPEEGCLIYEERPILCRLFGTSTIPLLACKRGLTSDDLLSTKEVWEIMGLWGLL